MSKQQAGEAAYYSIAGALTTGGVGLYLFELLGAVALGILGAIGGWIANKYIIPRLNKYFKK